MHPNLDELRFCVDAATGRRPGTLLLRNALLLNILSGETYPTDILMAGPWIAALGEGYTADQYIDLNGAYVTPGLIDGHFHLESSLVEPREYARTVVPRGVTAAVCDPHEIANVLGMTGIEYILKATASLPIDIFLTASSCVPSTTLETSGATLGLSEINALLANPRVVGVAELMNYPGITSGDPIELKKALLAGAHRKVADGHAPLVRGRALNAYLATGISSDHESSDPAEAQEKLRLGLTLMIRESTAARNLAALLPLVRPENAHQICWVTDDRDPADLLDEGGVDCLVRRSIQSGLDPLLAVRLGSLNAARHFRLDRRGAVAPGYLADLIVLSSLEQFAADMVFKSGRLVAREGHLVEDLPRYFDPAVLQTVKLPPLTIESFALPPHQGQVRVIELIPGEILTRQCIESFTGQDADPGRDIAKLAVVERHGRAGSIGIGLVRGFGLQHGALASTVGHDAHNLVIAGVNDADMLLAAQTLAASGGGFCVTADGQVLASLPLPIAGLMSDQPIGQVRAGMDALATAAKALGVTLPGLFMTLSFLALPVIPELKLTDHGLVETGSDGLRLVELQSGGTQ